LFDAIKEDVLNKGTCPTYVELEDKLKYIEKTKRKLISEVVHEILKKEPEAFEFIKLKLADYSKRLKFHGVFREAQVLYNSGNSDGAYDITMSGITDLYNITFNDDEIVHGADLEKLRSRYVKESALAGSRFVPTMIAQLDEILGGGLEKGRLGDILAFPKKGKSQALTHFGIAGLYNNAKVVHFVLEGLTEEATVRYQARMTGLKFNNLMRDIVEKEDEEKLKKIERFLQNLRIVPMNKHWDYSVLDVETKLKELERAGFIPDLVVLDYADLLKGRNKFKASDKRHEVTEVYRDLKKLCMMRKFACWTASQAKNKDESAEKEFLLRSGDVSESFEKARIVDFLGTLNRTTKEEFLGITRLYADIYRSNACNKTIRLVNDYRRSTFSSTAYPKLEIPSWIKRRKK
jgi:KaiC/GvpD/RAD55 family RecA-like ATPase